MILNPIHDDTARPLHLVTEASLPDTMKQLNAETVRFMRDQGFQGKSGELCLWHDREGFFAGACYGMSDHDDPAQRAFDLAVLQDRLPAKTFQIFGELDRCELFAMAWLMHRYKIREKNRDTSKEPKVILPKAINLKEVEALAKAIHFGRDLVNAPANKLGTKELVAEAQKLSEAFDANCHVIQGTDLEKGFPLIAAVGAGSPRPPALIDITWGNSKHPSLTLIGKGIVFDTGGLDIKPPSAMRNMKKDMGGAAAALTLAQMIMACQLPIRLRVLIPTAENACDGKAFRPGDVFASRKGITVEIGDTDAEGRLVLADALAYAMEKPSDLTFDFATLTGAARVALGTDLAALFSHDETLTSRLKDLGQDLLDPLWPLPLWAPYTKGLKSDVADLCNITGTGYGGAITAALFLEAFVSKKTTWAHIDLFAWNMTDRPGRPKGGDVTTVRTIYHYLKTWCAK